MSFEEIGGWPYLLSRLAKGQDLESAETQVALAEILEGNATPAQIAAFMFGLRCKGESVEEMVGMLAAMLEAAERVELPEALAGRVIDTCGTGGDRSGTINVSTISALVVAGAGVPVCKHGGRAASSRAGSADLLEALGVVIDLGPAGALQCLEKANIAFCFAPKYHPAMRHAGPVRGQLGVPTAFNFLGPLANPARVRRQVVGVGDPSMATKMVQVLAAGGSEYVMVVHGADGLDELSTTGVSVCHTYEAGTFTTAEVDPVGLGLAKADLADLVGGDTATNVDLARRVLGGETGPRRDIVLLNSAAGLVVAGAAASLAEGVELAASSIDEGRAQSSLDRLVSVSQAAAGS